MHIPKFIIDKSLKIFNIKKKTTINILQNIPLMGLMTEIKTTTTKNIQKNQGRKEFIFVILFLLESLSDI